MCDCSIVTSIVISIVSPVIISLALWLFLKPSLKIEIEIDPKDREGVNGGKHKIRIKITNKSCCSGAINLKVEVCSVKDENTHHMPIDKDDFILLPRGRKERTFKTTEESVKLIEKLSEKDVILRVRVYAAHSFSGFGEVFQAHFRYDPKTNSFDKVKFCRLLGITILWYKKKAQWRKV